MAFLTGVDLEGRLAEEPEESALALLPPPRPRPVRKKSSANFAIDDAPRPRVEYTQLLKDVSSYGNTEEDPLEELRRLVRKTRAKMDTQTKVLNGFITDVAQINGMSRSFSSSDLSALPPPSSAAALPGPRGDAARGARQLALRSGGGSSALALRRPDPPSEPRGQARRSEGIAASRSMPMLPHADTTAAKLPARRPPPGGFGREEPRSSALARMRAASSAQLQRVGMASVSPSSKD